MTTTIHSPSITADYWARYTVIEFLKSQRRLRIGSSGDLYRSFVHHVESSAGGDLNKIQLSFLYWGTFVDMGVGKGTKLNDVADNSSARRLQGRGHGRRRAKKWYSKTMEREVFKLSRILEDKYGILAFNTIRDTLPRKIVF